VKNETRSRPPRRSTPVSAVPLRSLLRALLHRSLDEDVLAQGEDWLKNNGLQRQLEFEGYQLRWANADRLDLNFKDGWEPVRVSHFLWWQRRVRRAHAGEHQYLLKRTRSSRS